MRLDDVQKLLDKACEAAGGQRAFAAQHDLSVQYISQVLHGIRPPSDKLCRALGIVSDGMRWARKAPR